MNFFNALFTRAINGKLGDRPKRLSADGQEFEGIGVPVDQQQPFFTQEQRQTEQDTGLSAAIDWINSIN